MKVFKSVGGVWKKGDRLFISLMGKPYNAYANNKKTNQSQPDWNITVIEDVGESEKGETKHPKK